MYTDRVFGTAKCILFIKVSSFQGVLNKGFDCIHKQGVWDSKMCPVHRGALISGRPEQVVPL